MEHRTTYKMISQVKRFFPFYLFTFLLFLSSCNLFIDEDELADDYGFTNVPEYSGEGYDEPVTTTTGDCEVTYQLKKTVRKITDEDTPYITYVNQDQSGLFMEIHYSAQTPDEQLPQRGQILVSTDVETFPMGCMHRVQTVEKRDGEYCLMTTLAELDETFEELDITGQVSTTESGIAYVEAEPEEESDEPATARSGDGPSNRAIGLDGGMSVGLTDGGFYLSYDFPTKPFWKLSTPEVTKTEVDLYFNEGSTYRETHTLNFDDFSFSRRSFKITYEMEQDYNLSLHIGSEFKGKVSIAKFRLIKGRPLVIGPVVLVLFANLNFGFEASLKTTVDVSRHVVTRNTYNLDLMHPLDLNKTERVVSDTGWNCAAMISGTMGLRATLELCIGLYGKILSLRLSPSVFVGFEATVASPVDWDGGVPIYDVSKKPGLTPKFDFQMEMGIYFELSFLDFFKGIFEKITSSNIGTALERLVQEATDNSDWYKEHSAKDSWSDKDLERFRRKESDDNSSITHTVGPWAIKKFPTIPWYPTIADNSFRIDNYYDGLTNKMYFDASYTIDQAGFFANLAEFIPAICIKHNGDIERIICPDGDGSNARVKSGTHYTFTLPEYTDDRTRLAQPCYIPLNDAQRRPVAFDKGLPFCSTSPSASIVNFKYKGCNKLEGTFNVPVYNSEEDNYDNRFYDYQFTYSFDVTVAAKGTEYMWSWGLYEAYHYQRYEYGQGENKDIYAGNGNYIFHCTLNVYSNYDNPDRVTEICLFPTISLKDGDTYHPEEASRWRLYLDGRAERF